MLKIGDWGIIGTKGFFLNGFFDSQVLAFYMFQMVFMDTAATIPTGAMAERWKFSSFIVFALWLGWLPSAGWHTPSARILPALVLSLRPMAYFTRVTRAAMIDVLQAPYITAARSRGKTSFV